MELIYIWSLAVNEIKFVRKEIGFKRRNKNRSFWIQVKALFKKNLARFMFQEIPYLH